MEIDIRLPQINAPTEKEQIKQISSYLFQLAEQLQWALKNVDTSNNTVVVSPTPRSTFDVADGWDVIGRVRSLGKGKATIPSGADLNNYKEFGVYDVTANVYAENIANCPIGKAGRLIVSSGTGDGKQSGTWVYILQEYITFDGKYQFHRSVYVGSVEDEWVYGKWECRSDTFWIGLGLSSAVSQSNSAFGRYQNGNVWYRVTNENHVHVAFNCAFTFSGDPITVSSNPIPSPYKPARNVYAMCPVNNRGIARILVKPDGNILIDYVQSMAASDVTSTYTVTWIDGYIDFWI